MGWCRRSLICRSSGGDALRERRCRWLDRRGRGRWLCVCESLGGVSVLPLKFGVKWHQLTVVRLLWDPGGG